MNVKGMKPIDISVIPEDQVLIQITFRKNGTLYNINALNDAASLAMSQVLRDSVVQMMMAVFAGNVAKAFDIDIVPGAVNVPDRGVGDKAIEAHRAANSPIIKP